MQVKGLQNLDLDSDFAIQRQMHGSSQLYRIQYHADIILEVAQPINTRTFIWSATGLDRSMFIEQQTEEQCTALALRVSRAHYLPLQRDVRLLNRLGIGLECHCDCNKSSPF
jgi:hypothetical protein